MPRKATLVKALKEVFESDPASKLHYSEVIKRVAANHPNDWDLSVSYVQTLLNALHEGGFLDKPDGPTGYFCRSL